MIIPCPKIIAHLFFMLRCFLVCSGPSTDFAGGGVASTLAYVHASRESSDDEGSQSSPDKDTFGRINSHPQLRPLADAPLTAAKDSAQHKGASAETQTAGQVPLSAGPLRLENRPIRPQGSPGKPTRARRTEQRDMHSMSPVAPWGDGVDEVHGEAPSGGNTRAPPTREKTRGKSGGGVGLDSRGGQRREEGAGDGDGELGVGPGKEMTPRMNARGASREAMGRTFQVGWPLRCTLEPTLLI